MPGTELLDAAEHERAALDHANDEDALRVAGNTNPTSLAISISNAVYEGKPPMLRAIGAGAINQAQKALAIARGYVAQQGYDLFVKPGFVTFQTDEGENRTAMTFRVMVTH